MEKEFSSAKASNGNPSIDTRNVIRRAIALCISLILMLQMVITGVQVSHTQSANAATLPPHGLVYEYAYGVRSDGVSYFGNDGGYTQIIVNSSGKVVFDGGDGFAYLVSYKMDADYLGGNLIISEHVGNDNLYGLLDPCTGRYIRNPEYTHEEIISYCKSQGWNTNDPVDWENFDDNDLGKQTLPNGAVVAVERDYDSKTLKYLVPSGDVAKVSGYELGNTKAGRFDEHYSHNSLFHTNIAGGNLYYAHNSNGKVGAINDKGEVLIPFEYDAYYDANAGSNYALLQKNGSWEYFDLTSIKNPSSSQTTPAYTEGWVYGSRGWWYRMADGSYPKSCSKTIDNAVYRFDSSGWMRTGWIKEGDNWYYHNASGAMAKGWVYVGGAWYYLDPSTGIMQTGKMTIDGATYFLTSSGAMKTGWNKEGGDWYYYNASGAMAKGWAYVGGAWYYLDPSSGVMQTGKMTIGGATYFLTSSGAMKTGWNEEGDPYWYRDSFGDIRKGSNWYYYGSSGAMTKGWISLGGTWYYLSPSDGLMQTGLYKVGDVDYYSHDSGAMHTGWLHKGNKWYYFSGSGAMQKSRWIGNYWVASDGVMATNSWVDNGRYYVGGDGAWVPGAKK